MTREKRGKDYLVCYDFMGINVSKCMKVYNLNVCKKIRDDFPSSSNSKEKENAPFYFTQVVIYKTCISLLNQVRI